MNWKEFKEHIESQGVTDDMKIEDVAFLQTWPYPPRVNIYPDWPYNSFSIY